MKGKSLDPSAATVGLPVSTLGWGPTALRLCGGRLAVPCCVEWLGPTRRPCT
jgi:hypothetical protein